MTDQNGPEHLSLGTSAENSHARSQRWRSAFGTRHPNAKLTEDDVRSIHSLRGSVPTRAIARQYGVDARTIDFIFGGEHWRHVTGQMLPSL